MGVDAVVDVGLVENGHNFFARQRKENKSISTCTVDVGVTDSWTKTAGSISHCPPNCQSPPFLHQFLPPPLCMFPSCLGRTLWFVIVSKQIHWLLVSSANQKACLTTGKPARNFLFSKKIHAGWLAAALGQIDLFSPVDLLVYVSLQYLLRFMWSHTASLFILIYVDKHVLFKYVKKFCLNVTNLLWKAALFSWKTRFESSDAKIRV